MKKLLLVFVASLVTILVCYGTGVSFGPESFVFSWILNFSLMAWYTYVASQYHFKFASPYFEEKHFEKGGGSIDPWEWISTENSWCGWDGKKWSGKIFPGKTDWPP